MSLLFMGVPLLGLLATFPNADSSELTPDDDFIVRRMSKGIAIFRSGWRKLEDEHI